MNEFWDSVISGTVSGIATAAVWAGAIWAINAVRNALVERDLRKALSRIGSSYEDEGFGVTLKNETEYPIIVRDVTLLTNQPEHGLGLVFVEPLADFLIQEKKTKKPMTFNTQTIGRRIEPVFTSHGFVEIPPLTGGKWQLPTGFYLQNPNCKPTACRATIEYKTLLGSPKLIIVTSNDGNARLLADQYEKFLEYIRKKIEANKGSGLYFHTY